MFFKRNKSKNEIISQLETKVNRLKQQILIHGECFKTRMLIAKHEAEIKELHKMF